MTIPYVEEEETPKNEKMDSKGRCIAHPFVQLQMFSSTAREFKVLLKSCPICEHKCTESCPPPANTATPHDGDDSITPGSFSSYNSDLLGGGSGKNIPSSSRSQKSHDGTALTAPSFFSATLPPPPPPRSPQATESTDLTRFSSSTRAQSDIRLNNPRGVNANRSESVRINSRKSSPRRSRSRSSGKTRSDDDADGENDLRKNKAINNLSYLSKSTGGGPSSDMSPEELNQWMVRVQTLLDATKSASASADNNNSNNSRERVNTWLDQEISLEAQELLRRSSNSVAVSRTSNSSPKRRPPPPPPPTPRRGGKTPGESIGTRCQRSGKSSKRRDPRPSVHFPPPPPPPPRRNSSNTNGVSRINHDGLQDTSNSFTTPWFGNSDPKLNGISNASVSYNRNWALSNTEHFMGQLLRSATKEYEERRSQDNDDSREGKSLSNVSDRKRPRNKKKEKKRKDDESVVSHMHVDKLFHTDSDGKEGWYTGKVDKMFLPHDKDGVIQYSKKSTSGGLGITIRGEWYHGTFKGIPSPNGKGQKTLSINEGEVEMASSSSDFLIAYDCENNDINFTRSAAVLSDDEDRCSSDENDDSSSIEDSSDENGASSRSSYDYESHHCHSNHRRQDHCQDKRPYQWRRTITFCVSMLGAALLILCIIYTTNKGKKQSDAQQGVGLYSDIPSRTPMTTPENKTTSSLVTVSSNELGRGQGKSYGIFFDVETTKSLPSSSSLIIEGIDLYVAAYDMTSPTHYEVWTKPGSWQEHESSQHADAKSKPVADYLRGFRKISHGTFTGKGQLVDGFTTIDRRQFQDVEIKGGTRQAFWITLSDDILLFKSYYTGVDVDGEGVNAIISRSEMMGSSVLQASNSVLKVYYGAAVFAYPLKLVDQATDFWDNAGFLGRIWTKVML